MACMPFLQKAWHTIGFKMDFFKSQDFDYLRLPACFFLKTFLYMYIQYSKKYWTHAHEKKSREDFHCTEINQEVN